MIKFDLYDQSTAPDESKAMLAGSVKDFGMIPGLHAVMAESPNILEAYKMLHKLVLSSSFDKDELTVVWQSINVEHSCHYCVPAHTGIAMSMGVDEAITNALRDKTPLPNTKLEALRDFTLTVIRNRGHVDDAGVQAFVDAGFNKRHILEVVLVASQKVMSNYVNHLTKTPVDEAFQKFAWKEGA